MKFNQIFYSLIFLITITMFSGCKSENNNSLKIAVSANVQFAMKEIVSEFKKTFNKEVDIIVSSSGKLTAQIEQGAPFDVFLSADEKFPKRLFENNLTIGKPKVYAKGKLVLISTNQNNLISIAQLSSDRCKKIAIANPSTAPYGEAAEFALKESGIYDSIKNKLIFGESVSQINQYIYSNAVDAGFTAMSVVFNKKIMQNFSWFEIPSNLYPKINQAVVIINRKDQDIAAAKHFFDFLFSAKARSIFENYGYAVGDNE